MAERCVVWGRSLCIVAPGRSPRSRRGHQVLAVGIGERLDCLGLDHRSHLTSRFRSEVDNSPTTHPSRCLTMNQEYSNIGSMPMVTDETVVPQTELGDGRPLIGDRPLLAPFRGRSPFDAGPVPEAGRDVQRTGGPGGSGQNFWDDGADEICFTEMQALAHHGGALAETDPDALWQALEAAVATVPLDLAMRVGSRRGSGEFSTIACGGSRSPPSSCGRTSRCSSGSGIPSTTCGKRRCRSSKRRDAMSWRNTRAGGHWRYS